MQKGYIANAGDVSGAHGFYTTTNTMYYVTFQMERGDRMEFQVSGIEYGMLADALDIEEKDVLRAVNEYTDALILLD